MTIIFEAQNANEDFIKLVKSVAKLANVKIKTQRDKSNDFIPFTETESYKQFQKMKAQMTEQEKQELEAELQKEMNRDYSYEL